MNVLYINTIDNKKTLVHLKTDKKLFEEIVDTKDLRSSQVVLGLIKKVLEKSNIDLNEVDSIAVEKGPGSFTGVRVGVSIANALSFALQKKVNDKNLGEIEIAEYSV